MSDECAFVSINSVYLRFTNTRIHDLENWHLCQWTQLRVLELIDNVNIDCGSADNLSCNIRTLGQYGRETSSVPSNNTTITNIEKSPRTDSTSASPIHIHRSTEISYSYVSMEKQRDSATVVHTRTTSYEYEQTSTVQV